MIEIGFISKAQGIKGEIKLQLSTEFDLIKDLKVLTINNETYDIESIISRQNGVFIKLKQVADRSAAELLRGKKVFAKKEHLKALAEDQYFYDDLIGSIIVDESYNTLAEIIDIEQYGASDIIVTKEGDLIYSLPFLDDIFLKFEAGRKMFVVNKENYNSMKICD